MMAAELIADRVNLGVVEHGVVEGETDLDGVASGEVDLDGILLALDGFLLELVQLRTLSVLGDVAIVVTDHLDKKVD